MRCRPRLPAGRPLLSAPHLTLPCAFLLGLAALLSLFLAAPAAALPEYEHDGATECTVCHHAAPSSFQPCVDCHPDAATPNKVCQKCHSDKLTNDNQTCWQCHRPGAPQPPPTDENCQECHGKMPHLGAAFGNDPGCTICHSTNPTPHHDGKQHFLPQTCTDCHAHENKQSHDQQPCTACHATDVHPSIPEVPSVCNRCHEAPIYNGVGNCLKCHSGVEPFDGKTDNDIHNESIPDAPISTSSCRSCHPENHKHVGRIACLTCHPDATSFHHGMAPSPGFKPCVDCHGQKPQHDGGLPCERCHTNAQHQLDPPTPSSKNCTICHAPSQTGTENCCRCHTPPIYHVTPSVPGCTACHPGKKRHAGTIACTTCHPKEKAFHHGLAKSPGFKSCTACHGNKRQHGNGLVCQRCHVNAMHQTRPPTPSYRKCNICHAKSRVGTRNCYRCHTLPIYHVTPFVGPCSSCHGPKQKHAGKVACRQCHTNVDSGHHLTAVVIPSCQKSGCHAQQWHAGQISCNRCHPAAAHDATPLNLPSPPFSICLQCHSLASKAPPCSRCHDSVQHKVDVAVPPCQDCHANKQQHAGKVACCQCHTNVGPGHHRSGAVGALICSDCHLGTQVHAAAKPGGDSFSCQTCHPGNVHGVLGLPGGQQCLDCHAPAAQHADNHACVDCHAPAAHSADPSAKDYGSAINIKTILPRSCAQANEPGGVPVPDLLSQEATITTGESSSTADGGSTLTGTATGGATGTTTSTTAPKSRSTSSQGWTIVLVLSGVAVLLIALVVIELFRRTRRNKA